ncbi:hypothetical protein JCM8547_004248 [Rhodosporidiobolus lusitaniae]
MSSTKWTVKVILISQCYPTTVSTLRRDLHTGLCAATEGGAHLVSCEVDKEESLVTLSFGDEASAENVGDLALVWGSSDIKAL